MGRCSDDLREELARLIVVCAYRAYTNVLSGDQSPVQRAYYERVSKPRVGDLVVETSTIYATRHGSLNSVGRLVSVEREPYPLTEDERKNLEPDEPPPSRNVWTIETFDGRRFRWENCSFVVVPPEIRWPDSMPCEED